MSTLSGFILELRAFGTVRQHMDTLLRANQAVRADMYRARWVSRVGTAAFKDIAILLMVAGLLALRFADATDIAVIGSVAVLVLRSVGYAQRVQGARQAINEDSQYLEIALSRIQSLDADVDDPGSLNLESFDRMVVDRVRYVYPDGRVGLEEASIELRKGDYLGVIGHSGGGKSTLAELLLRLRRPASGSIEVDGVDLNELQADWIARNFAYVPQQPHLFEGSIAENIRIGREWVAPEKVEDAAVEANILEEVMQLEHGFDTRLGPRGSGLSGGQRQRIAIARALAGSPELIVFDEPTSALDSESEMAIQDAIERLSGQVTLVVIAHRLTTLAGCERVVAMNDGRTIAEGSLDCAVEQLALRAPSSD